MSAKRVTALRVSPRADDRLAAILRSAEQQGIPVRRANAHALDRFASGGVGAAGGSPGAAHNGHAIRGPVVEALVGLGFAVKQAEEATDKVLAGDPDANTQSALRAALSLLGKTK